MSAATLPTPTPSNQSLLEALLRDQQDLTAVSRFAEWHDHSLGVEHAPHYRALIPLAAPAPGEQYAFEVDLQTCSGCKACVTACHNLNGLDEHETWRNVGLLQAVGEGLPTLQHVTTACHHCVEPACMGGCPTQAYAKDSVTGIVRHLDDQCFGCQYCILMCPYEVPTYTPQRGIVRKCDMCSQRLSNHELPACVQGCPNSAIAIRIVSQDALRDRATAEQFLPTAPDPRITIPTTTYIDRNPTGNVEAGDHDQFHVAHAHWPLVLMLVLTQMSVGILGVGHILIDWLDWLPAIPARAILNSIAAGIGVIGANLALLHLGRPLQAYRAWLGWRTSWLSREVLAFGVYVPLVLSAALAAWLPSGWLHPLVSTAVELLGIGVGIVAIYCSAMIYIATRRGCWSRRPTLTRFAMTTFMLGNATCATVGAAIIGWEGGSTLWDYRIPLATMLIGGGVAITRGYLFYHWLRIARTHSDMSLRGCARLVETTLQRVLFGQFVTSAVAAFVLPVFAVAVIVANPPIVSPLVTAICGLRLIIAFGAEVTERFLFFASSVSTRMPGAPLR